VRVRVFFHLLGLLLWIYLLALVIRMVFGWVQFFVRDFKPRGAVLIIAELIYTITDPPLNLLRRFIPPLRLGNMAVDLGFMVVFFVVMMLSQIFSMV
jgi:YggT family protein